MRENQQLPTYISCNVCEAIPVRNASIARCKSRTAANRTAWHDCEFEPVSSQFLGMLNIHISQIKTIALPFQIFQNLCKSLARPTIPAKKIVTPKHVWTPLPRVNVDRAKTVGISGKTPFSLQHFIFVWDCSKACWHLEAMFRDHQASVVKDQKLQSREEFAIHPIKGTSTYSTYEVKNYVCWFERPIKVNKNGIFFFEISSFIPEIFKVVFPSGRPFCNCPKSNLIRRNYHHATRCHTMMFESLVAMVTEQASQGILKSGFFAKINKPKHFITKARNNFL